MIRAVTSPPLVADATSAVDEEGVLDVVSVVLLLVGDGLLEAVELELFDDEEGDVALDVEEPGEELEVDGSSDALDEDELGNALDVDESVEVEELGEDVAEEDELGDELLLVVSVVDRPVEFSVSDALELFEGDWAELDVVSVLELEDGLDVELEPGAP